MSVYEGRGDGVLVWGGLCEAGHESGMDSAGGM